MARLDEKIANTLLMPLDGRREAPTGHRQRILPAARA